jgi:hypothetical protein
MRTGTRNFIRTRKHTRAPTICNIPTTYYYAEAEAEADRDGQGVFVCFFSLAKQMMVKVMVDETSDSRRW